MQIEKYTLKTHISHALKICKHEFFMSRILLIIVFIIAFINLLLLMCNKTDTTLFFILVLIQFFALIVCSIAYLLVVAISFYQGIFGKHAYLTHALPIRLETIICSKILICFLWFLVIFASLIFTIYAITNGTSFMDGFYYVSHSLGDKSHILAFHAIFLTILSALEEIVFIFMVVAIVHRKKTYMLLIGILTYFFIKILLLIIVAILMQFLPDTINSDVLIYVYYVCHILLILLFYSVCYMIIKYKLSL